MTDKIILSENLLRNIVEKAVKHCLKKVMLKEHMDVVNNLELAKDMVRKQWKNPDNFWYIIIVQRAKDNDKVLNRNGKSIFKNKPGKTKKNILIDNNIGYAIVKGNTVDEALESLMYPTITLFKDSIDIFGELAGGNGRVVTCDKSNGEISNIKEICDATNSRAVMTTMRNSYTNASTKFNAVHGRMETQHREALLSSDGEIVGDYTILLKAMHPTRFSGHHMLLIDCDIDSDDIKKVNDVLGRIKKILNKNGVEIYKISKNGNNNEVFASHNGYHIWVDAESETNRNLFSGKNEKEMAIKLNNLFKSEFGSVRSHKGREDSLVMMEKPSMSNILLYSSAGYSDRNTENPEWAKRWGNKFALSRQ